MSYCRWSSDCGECDVYVYEDVSGGWTTHVAGRKLKHRVPDEVRALFAAVDWQAAGAAERWKVAHDAEQAWRASLPCEVIQAKDSDGNAVPTYWPLDSEYYDLPESHAGESYNDSTPGECAERLEELRKAGFRVPQYAIDALREEQQSLGDR